MHMLKSVFLIGCFSLMSKSVGSKYERELKNILEERGWLVIRSAGSLGTGDLIAIGPKLHILIVESKKTNPKRATKAGLTRYYISGDRKKEQFDGMMDTFEWFEEKEKRGKWTVCFALRRTFGRRKDRWSIHNLPLEAYKPIKEEEGVTLDDYLVSVGS